MESISYPDKPKCIDDLTYFPDFNNNWRYTKEKLFFLNQKLNEAFDNDDTFCIAVAGSYGRMEASEQSDIDYIIIFKESNIDAKLVKNIREKIKAIAEELSIVMPNPEGVFSQTLSRDMIVEDIGNKDENLTVLAQRMLLLMESKAIYNEELFKEVVTQILKKYLKFVISDPTKEALFLLNDLIRYFRSIAVNYEYSFGKDNQKWTLRNVKLRHSRVVIYAGLLLLIMDASKDRKDKFQYFENHIHLTPIERIVTVYTNNNDFNYVKLLGAYNMFLNKINDDKIRQALKVEYDDRYDNPHYANLKVSSDLLQSELSRFVFAQKNNWSQQIYEYLIF